MFLSIKVSLTNVRLRRSAYLSLLYTAPWGVVIEPNFEQAFNVYAFPIYIAKPISTLYSVMIFVGGGAYISGDASSYGPDFLIEKDVILVTFNYRIGALGFLSLGTPLYSGNMGLKDQVMAFKWVKRNIRFFGGNPETVTVFGQSAGKW